MIERKQNETPKIQFKLYFQFAPALDSIGSNSPSAHESVFHTAVEFELVGLVMMWLDDKLGKSFGRLFWSMVFTCLSSIIVSFMLNFELFILVICCRSFSFSSLSSRSSSFWETNEIEFKMEKITSLLLTGFTSFFVLIWISMHLRAALPSYPNHSTTIRLVDRSCLLINSMWSMLMVD